MTSIQTYPGGLTELAFVEAYHNGALRKPQVVADSLLRTLVLAPAADRLMLSGLLAEQLAEACRRLVAVVNALADRRYQVGRTLLNPLPGLAEWERFIQQAASFSPEQMLRELSLGEGAHDSAVALRSQHALDAFSPLVAAAEAGGSMVLIPPTAGVPAEAWFAGLAIDHSAVAALVRGDEQEAAGMADCAADLVSIARGFLREYLHARQTAGRRE